MATKSKTSRVPVAATTLMALADGYAGRAIDSALAKVMEDIINRGDKKKRTVTIKLEITPSEGGRVKIAVSADARLPAYIPSETIATIDHDAGGLMFSPDCSDNPDQLAIPGTGVDD